MHSDAIRRGIRTFIDIAFVEAVIQLLVAFGVDLTEAQHAAILVIAPFFVSAGKNALEDAGTLPALLKAPASDGENPVPDAGVTVLEAALLGAVVSLLVLAAFDVITITS